MNMAVVAVVFWMVFRLNYNLVLNAALDVDTVSIDVF